MADIGLKIGLEGEKAFKRSLSEINSTFKVLGSEMKLVESQFGKNESSTQALTAKNEVLRKEITAQKEKIETLQSALKNASESFGEADRRTMAWQVQLNNAKADLNKLEGELDDNEKALSSVSDEFDDAEKQADDFEKQVKETGNQTESAKGKFEKIGTALKSIGKAMAAATAAIGTAAAAAGKKLVDMAGETAKAGDEIDKTSQKLGMSAEAYQEWDYVLGQSGVEITSMTTGLKTLTNQISKAKNGTQASAEMFSKLGISISDLESMSREDIFAATIKGLQGMEDGTERAALANKLFGKSGQELTPLFNQTAESTEELMKAAHDLGFVMSNEAVSASAAYQDSLDTLTRTFSGVKNNIMSELLPGMTSIMTGLSELLVGGKDAKDKIQSGAQEIVDKFAELFPKVSDILMTLILTAAEVAPELITSLVTGITANLPKIAASVGDIVMTFLTSLISSLPQFTSGALEVVLTLVEGIIDNLPKIIDAACQVIVSLANGLADSIPRLIPSIVSAVIQICTTIADNLPLILKAALKLVLALAKGIIDSIPELVNRLPKLIKSIVSFLISSIPQLISAGVKLLTAIVSNLPAIISGVVAAIPKIISAIVSGFGSSFGTMSGIGQNLVRGLWNGILSLKDWLWSSVSSWISGIWTGIKNFFGIHSPSKQMGWIGEMLVRGLSDSIDDNADEAVTSAKNMSKDILSSFDDLNRDLVTTVPTGISAKTSAPVYDFPKNSTPQFTIELNISNFNNYGVEDIRQLTNEVMETANSFMLRRGVAFG